MLDFSLKSVKKIIRFLFLILSLICAANSHAQTSILAVISQENSIYKKFYLSLQSKLTTQVNLEVIDLAEVYNKDLSVYDKVISIGSNASRYLAQRGYIKHIIYTLIPQNLLKEINSENCLSNKCQYVLIEQPLDRYFQLFKAVFSNRHTLVIASTADSKSRISEIRSLSRKYNVRHKIIKINKNDFVAKKLINQLNKDEVLLALPDPAIYNKNTAKSIILSSYHKNVPIIAYSAAFANAGALISLYSSLDDIADQTSILINSGSAPKKKTYYPDNFTLKINNAVSRSLDINLDNIEDVKRLIK